MQDNKDFSVTFLVDNTPQEAFDAINNARGWWSQGIDGDTGKLGAEFEYHYQDVHRCAFKITEFVPGKKVVWHVLDNYFSFVKDKNEWIGTDVVFEIARKGDKTEVHFTHVGLVPAYECYSVCSDAWGSYIAGSLRNLIAAGKGQPNPIEEIVSKARQMSYQSYTTSFTVDQSPEVVFAALTMFVAGGHKQLRGVLTNLVLSLSSTQKASTAAPRRSLNWCQVRKSYGMS